MFYSMSTVVSKPSALYDPTFSISKEGRVPSKLSSKFTPNHWLQLSSIQNILQTVVWIHWRPYWRKDRQSVTLSDESKSFLLTYVFTKKRGLIIGCPVPEILCRITCLWIFIFWYLAKYSTLFTLFPFQPSMYILTVPEKWKRMWTWLSTWIWRYIPHPTLHQLRLKERRHVE